MIVDLRFNRYLKPVVLIVFAVGALFYGVHRSNQDQGFREFYALAQNKTDLTDISASSIVLLLTKRLNGYVYDSFNGNELFNKNLENMNKVKEPISCPWHHLQDYCDASYFVHLFVQEKKFKLSQNFLDKYFNTATIQEIKDPHKAIVYLICLESLKIANPDFFVFIKDEQHYLETVIQQDDTFYGYLLTHIILYDMQFGTQEPTQRSFNAFNDLKKYAQNLVPTEQNVDLVGEIVLCYKLLRSKKGRWFKNALKVVSSKKEFNNFHEQCVAVVALV